VNSLEIPESLTKPKLKIRFHQNSSYSLVSFDNQIGAMPILNFLPSIWPVFGRE
jgi:hypothetical protein